MIEGIGIEVFTPDPGAIGPLPIGRPCCEGEYRALTLAEKRMLDCALREKLHERSNLPSRCFHGREKSGRKRSLQ